MAEDIKRKKRTSKRKKDPEMLAKMREMGRKAAKANREKSRIKREEPEKAELSGKELDFVNNFTYNETTRGNATQSYMAAYLCDHSTALNRGHQKIKEPHIKVQIDKRMKELEDTYAYMKHDIVNVLHKTMHEMVEHNPTDKEGNPLSPHLCRRVAISSADLLNKMLGFNAATKVETDNKQTFVFNLHVPKDEEDEDEIISIDGGYDEFEELPEAEENIEEDEG